eukprot:gene13242-17748_t
MHTFQYPFNVVECGTNIIEQKENENEVEHETKTIYKVYHDIEETKPIKIISQDSYDMEDEEVISNYDYDYIVQKSNQYISKTDEELFGYQRLRSVLRHSPEMKHMDKDDFYQFYRLGYGYNEVRLIAAMNSNENKKSVKFANTCGVILIPSRQEYFDAQIDLWFNRIDQNYSKNQVSSELQKVMEFNPAMTIDMAMHFLYQPHLDFHNAIFNRNLPEIKEKLQILIIDSFKESCIETSQQINDVMNGYQKWEILFSYASSINNAYENLTQAKNGLLKNINVILINENCDEITENYYSQRCQLLRSMYSKNMLIGLVMSNARCDGIKSNAISSGIDFIWPKPILSSVDMLPIMLIYRQRHQEMSKSKDEK